ncbi:MAG: adenylate/guanylate cyclase domain-containing protein [Deltaproteobacteria bacterium]|nr:adenylate/guanylate cyclase domain-containing protein [Deltaproteobacteria bacterium]
METINQLRSSMMARNKAYYEIEKTNEELKRAKERLDQINRELEKRVDERTAELREKQQEVIELNRHLEEKVRAQVAKLKRHEELRRYLSPQLSEIILNSEHGLEKEPQRRMLTVVFTDIRGFSDFTDSVEPEEAFHLLDRYLSEMTQIVHDHDGTLNKISGDGLLIFFGDPLPMKDHPLRAVKMAIAMQQKISELKEEWRQYGHELGVGIGVNTGFVTVGNVGSKMHRDYTVIGNQVNIAARLESSARAGEILISQRTYSKISEAVEAREVGEIQVKGVHHPVTVYSVSW